MTDEPEDTYEPEPTCLADGDVLLADPVELAELTGALAFMVDGGALFVLQRATGRWVNVEEALKPAGNVRSLRESKH